MHLHRITHAVRRTSPWALVLAAAAVVGGFERPAAARVGGDDATFTSEYDLRSRHFKPNGRNPYFDLRPGYQLILMGEEDGELLEVQITVLDEKRLFEIELPSGTLRVRARVIEERETADGELTEISRNYFARDVRTNDIFYFGEEVDIYEDGEVVAHDGAWLAGVDGAMPGIIMPGTFLLGARYFQEVAPGVALDRAEHTEMEATVATPAGTFHRCVVVVETTPLEPGAESLKVYRRGVGLVQDDVLQLVWSGFVGDAAHAPDEGLDDFDWRGEDDDDDGNGALRDGRPDRRASSDDGG